MNNYKTQFLEDNVNDDHLILQVISGDKTATCCPTIYFDESNSTFHDSACMPGELVEVYDIKENLRYIIKITEVYKTILNKIPENL